MLIPGHPSDRRDHVPGKITVKGGAFGAVTRDSLRSPLTVILVGSRLEHREDARSRGAVGGRDGGQLVTGGVRG
jgi:hypothetical protein